MDEKPIFKYFTGGETDQFTFYRIPKPLFTNSFFRDLSTEAKVLYGLMLDRISLSIKNHWVDEQNRVYIYFSVEDTMEYLNCRKNKAVQLLCELDSEKGIGLIEKKRQGQGKPTLIYVKNFFIPTDAGRTQAESSEKPEDRDPEVGNINFKKSENPTSRSLKNKPLEVGKTNPNKNKKSNTKINDTERKDILSDLLVSSPGQSSVRTMAALPDRGYMADDRVAESGSVTEAANLLGEIRGRIDYGALRKEYPFQTEMLDGICELMLEIEASQSETIVIASSRLPMSLVRERFRTLRCDHIQYVMDCILANTTKVRNVRKYMLAALFNAPATIDGYYQAEVNHDMPELARR